MKYDEAQRHPQPGEYVQTTFEPDICTVCGDFRIVVELRTIEGHRLVSVLCEDHLGRPRT